GSRHRAPARSVPHSWLRCFRCLWCVRLRRESAALEDSQRELTRAGIRSPHSAERDLNSWFLPGQFESRQLRVLGALARQLTLIQEVLTGGNSTKILRRKLLGPVLQGSKYPVCTISRLSS